MIASIYNGRDTTGFKTTIPSSTGLSTFDISTLAAQIASSDHVEDVHICGSCKRNFSDIDLFVEHKRTGCSAPSQKAQPTPAAPSSRPPLGYVTANTSSVNNDRISSVGPQFLRVIFDEANLNVEGNQPHDQRLPNELRSREDTENQILRARLLGIADQDTTGASHNFQNSNDLHSVELGEQQQSNAKQREFHIDEEDVATLLANQLASEVVNSVNGTSITSKTGLIDIPPEIVSKTRDHFDLCSVNLPNENRERNVSKQQKDQKHEKERKASKSHNSSSAATGNTSWTNGNKGNGSKNNLPMSSSTSASMKTSTICASSSVISQVATTGKSDIVADCSTGKKKYKCPVTQCDFATFYQKDLIRHERKHTGERPFQCYSCHRNFSRLDKLHMHQRIHTGDKRHRCKICDYATHDSGSLRKHMRIHNDERPYKCQMCPYRSRDSSQLTVHLRTHTGDNPFVCPYESCSSAFKTSSDLKRHARTHTGEKPFSCFFCDYKCAIKSNLRVHIRHNHSEATNICSSCGFVASSKRDLKEHEKSHADWEFKSLHIYPER